MVNVNHFGNAKNSFGGRAPHSLFFEKKNLHYKVSKNLQKNPYVENDLFYDSANIQPVIVYIPAYTKMKNPDKSDFLITSQIQNFVMFTQIKI